MFQTPSARLLILFSTYVSHICCLMLSFSCDAEMTLNGGRILYDLHHRWGKPQFSGDLQLQTRTGHYFYNDAVEKLFSVWTANTTVKSSDNTIIKETDKPRPLHHFVCYIQFLWQHSGNEEAVFMWCGGQVRVTDADSVTEVLRSLPSHSQIRYH